MKVDERAKIEEDTVNINAPIINQRCRACKRTFRIIIQHVNSQDCKRHYSEQEILKHKAARTMKKEIHG